MQTSRLVHYRFAPGLTYLNHGAFGALSVEVAAEQERFRAQVDANPVGFFHRNYVPLLDAARDALATFVGATSDALAFVANASEGISAVLRSIPFAPGDEVLTTSLGYDSVDNAVDEIAVKAGAEHRKVDVGFPVQNDEDIVRTITAAISSRTRLVILDHIASRSARRLPLSRLVASIRSAGGAGLEILVDGAHAPGAIALNISALDVDAYVGNAHKWLSAGRGAAFVVANAPMRDRLRPPTISHGASWKREGRSRFHNEFDWTGTRDPSAWLSLPAAIAFLNQATDGDADDVRREAAALCQSAVKRLANDGAIPATPADDRACMATVIIAMAPVDQAPVVARSVAAFFMESHRLETTVFSAGECICVRASFWLYNDSDDAALLATAVREARETLQLRLPTEAPNG